MTPQIGPFKTASRLFALSLCCALLTGCWDYRGLDELTVVAGIAVDVDEQNPGGYAVAFEIVDMNGSSDESMQSKMLETTGETLTEAVHNANKKLHNNMFFANTELLVVSEAVARERGLQVIIDPLLRDQSIRDNMLVLVSREPTAKEVITPLEDDPQIVSFGLNKIIGTNQENAYSANATRTLELDQIYNNLSTEKTQLALPSIRFDEAEHQELRLDGMAIFLQDRLVGHLEDADTPWFLLGTEHLRSGSLHVPLQTPQDAAPAYFTLDIDRSVAKKNCAFDGETFTFTVRVDMTAAVAELSQGWGKLTAPVVTEMEERAQQILCENILRTLETVRDGTGSDCFGFAAAVAKHSPALWREVEADWEQWFHACEFVVEADVFIQDTGHMKEF